MQCLPIHALKKSDLNLPYLTQRHFSTKILNRLYLLLPYISAQKNRLVPCLTHRGGWSRFKPRRNIHCVGLELAFNLLQPAAWVSTFMHSWAYLSLLHLVNHSSLNLSLLCMPATLRQESKKQRKVQHHSKSETNLSFRAHCFQLVWVCYSLSSVMLASFTTSI